MAEEVNQQVDNIGARRLYTIIERIVEDISFNAPEKVQSVQPFNVVRQSLGTTPSSSCSVHESNVMQAKEAAALGEGRMKYVVDKNEVLQRVGDLLKKQDLSKFIL